MTSREIHTHFIGGPATPVVSTIGTPATGVVYNTDFYFRQATYWIMVSTEVNCTSIDKVELFVGGGSGVDLVPRASSASEWVPTSFFYQRVVGAPDVGQSAITIKLTVGAGIISGTVRNTSLLIIEQVATDQAALSTTSKTGTDIAYVTWESFTVTPAGGGNYLFLVYAKCFGGQATDSMFIEITDGTTTWSESQFLMSGITEQRPWASMFRVTGMAAPTTYTIKVKALAGTAPYSFDVWRALVLDLDTFDGTYYSETSTIFTDRGRDSTSSTTYVDLGCTLTGTPNRGDHLLIACYATDASSTGAGSTSQIAENAAAVVPGESLHKNTLGSGNNDVITFRSIRRATTGAVMSWNNQMKKSLVGGGATVGIQDSALALLQIHPTNARVKMLGQTTILGKVTIQ